MNENSSNQTGTILLAFAGGAAFGAGLALLFAPQSGRATRRKIGSMAEDMEESAEEMVREASQGLKEARKKGTEWVGQVKDYVGAKKAELGTALDGAHS